MRAVKFKAAGSVVDVWLSVSSKMSSVGFCQVVEIHDSVTEIGSSKVQYYGKKRLNWVWVAGSGSTVARGTSLQAQQCLQIACKGKGPLTGNFCPDEGGTRF